jgi:uncharacterized membrane protein (UPF0136 family)
MIQFVKLFYLVFGILTAVGGLMGYLKGSTISLVAGGACGLLLVAAFFLLPAHPNPALILGLLVSVLLLGQFLPKLLHGEAKPHILVTSLLAAVSVVVTLLGWYKR